MSTRHFRQLLLSNSYDHNHNTTTCNNEVLHSGWRLQCNSNGYIFETSKNSRSHCTKASSYMRRCIVLVISDDFVLSEHVESWTSCRCFITKHSIFGIIYHAMSAAVPIVGVAGVTASPLSRLSVLFCGLVEQPSQPVFVVVPARGSDGLHDSLQVWGARPPEIMPHPSPWCREIGHSGDCGIWLENGHNLLPRINCAPKKHGLPFRSAQVSAMIHHAFWMEV